jgi:predicted nucleic acid-binding protein
MLNLFIDTNVFLSFYHLTSEDLEELKKLTALIDNQEITLFLPAQVRDEFVRNRGAKIADAMRKLKEARFTLSFPLFAKDYEQYSALRDLMKKADDLHAELVAIITADAESETLSADKIVDSLFDMAKTVDTGDEIYLAAKKRVRLGNPPGKQEAIGDAVNWECLLQGVPNKEDVHLVSGDKDFRSQLSDSRVNECLEQEWWERKTSHLYFYTKISDFFKSKFPNIKIAAELERDLLIQRLAHSGAFANTHTVIAKLFGQTEFSPAQVEQLAEIPDANNQVGWIIGDPDVHSFYAMLLAVWRQNPKDRSKQACRDSCEGQAVKRGGRRTSLLSFSRRVASIVHVRVAHR